jgi:hypothetical protein
MNHEVEKYEGELRELRKMKLIATSLLAKNPRFATLWKKKAEELG